MKKAIFGKWCRDSKWFDPLQKLGVKLGPRSPSLLVMFYVTFRSNCNAVLFVVFHFYVKGFKRVEYLTVFSLENIDCWYSLEPPRPQPML